MESINSKNEFVPITITPVKKFELPDFREIFDYKDLLVFLTLRDIKLRFQQTFIGVLWIILQPLIQVTIFTIILGLFIRVPTDVPYPVFFLSGFVVWQFFTQVVNTSAYSLVGNVGIILKIYFPRLILPLSCILSSVIDFLISLLVLLPFLVYNHIPFTSRYLLLPLLLIISVLFSSGVGLLFGALMVIFRDVKNLLNFILMVWMYATPIMYPLSVVPEKYQSLLFLNPLTGLVQSYRWVFLNSGTLPKTSFFLLSSIIALLMWIVGVLSFRAMENKIADVM